MVPKLPTNNLTLLNKDSGTPFRHLSYKWRTTVFSFTRRVGQQKIRRRCSTRRSGPCDVQQGVQVPGVNSLPVSVFLYVIRCRSVYQSSVLRYVFTRPPVHLSVTRPFRSGGLDLRERHFSYPLFPRCRKFSLSVTGLNGFEVILGTPLRWKGEKDVCKVEM